MGFRSGIYTQRVHHPFFLIKFQFRESCFVLFCFVFFWWREENLLEKNPKQGQETTTTTTTTTTNSSHSHITTGLEVNPMPDWQWELSPLDHPCSPTKSLTPA